MKKWYCRNISRSLFSYDDDVRITGECELLEKEGCKVEQIVYINEISCSQYKIFYSCEEPEVN